MDVPDPAIAHKLLIGVMAMAKTQTLEVEAEPTGAAKPGPQQSNGNAWRVAKDIPIALVGAIVLQTVMGVWWLSQLSSKLDAAVTNLAEFKSERYTREDARRDRDLLEQKLITLSTAAEERLRRISDLENRMRVAETRK